MTLTVYEDLEQGSDAWREARAGIVTASNAGKIVTPKTGRVANNETSRGYAASLAGERITGHPEPSASSWDMRRGTLSEPYARDIYADHTGSQVDEIGFYVRTFNDMKIGFSPDGVIGDEGLLEIKSPRPKHHIKTLLSGEVPEQHYPQLQAGLLVSGRQWVDFVSYSPGHPLFIKRVFRNDIYQDNLLIAASEVEEIVQKVSEQYLEASKGFPSTEWIDVFEEEEILI